WAAGGRGREGGDGQGAQAGPPDGGRRPPPGPPAQIAWAAPTETSRDFARARRETALPPPPSLRRLAHRLPLAQRLGIAGRNVGIGRIGTDAGQDLPGARALSSLRELHLDRHALDVVEPERVERTVALHERVVRRDGYLGEVDVDHRGEQV